jgi:hypothetical protein
MPDVLDGMLLAILVVGISGWAYGRVQAIMAAVDETPWSMDKTKEELDWSLRNEYIQKAAEPNATLSKLKPKLLERCMHAIQLYVVCQVRTSVRSIRLLFCLFEHSCLQRVAHSTVISLPWYAQDEQKDFSKVEHLLSTSVKDQTIRKFMEVTGEMEAIEAEANRLKPGWGETIFQEASEGIRAKRQQEQENMNRKRLEEQQKAFLEQVCGCRQARPPLPTHRSARLLTQALLSHCRRGSVVRSWSRSSRWCRRRKARALRAPQ